MNSLAMGGDGGLPNLDELLLQAQVSGGRLLRRKDAQLVMQRAVFDLTNLHQTGEHLRARCLALGLPGYLDYARVATNLSVQQKNGLLGGDTADYRVWLLRWRTRGAPAKATTFERLIPLLGHYGALQRAQAFEINEAVIVLNAMEQMHRGRLTLLKTVLMRLDQLALLQGQS